MFQLILVVLAIALASVTAVASINYLNPVPRAAQMQALRLESGFNDLANGYRAYVEAQGHPPAHLSDMTPHYAFTPAAPTGSAWSFGQGGVNNAGRYFCLSGTFAPVDIGAILRLRKVLSPQAYFINTGCGATSNAVPAADAASFTGAVTLWVAPYL